MFKTHAGPVEDSSAVAYLRPETAQGMFVNFANVLQTSRKKPPFGIAQVGKSFRNEITPQNWIFRTREFEQMEMQFFVPPADGPRWYEYWCNERLDWYVAPRHPPRPAPPAACTDPTSCRTTRPARPTSSSASRGASTSSRASPSAPTTTSSSTARRSGERLDYFDQATGERYTPYVIEPAAGATRTMAAFMLAAYDVDEVGGEERTVLRLHPRLAPYQVAVLPLSKKDTLTPVAHEVRKLLADRFMVDYDETQAIGRRYRRQDEIGTPLCVTVDFDTLDDKAVTIRDRDSTDQVRVPITSVVTEVADRLGCLTPTSPRALAAVSRPLRTCRARSCRPVSRAVRIAVQRGRVPRRADGGEGAGRPDRLAPRARRWRSARRSRRRARRRWIGTGRRSDAPRPRAAPGRRASMPRRPTGHARPAAPRRRRARPGSRPAT